MLACIPGDFVAGIFQRVQNSKMCHVTLIMTLSGMTCHQQAGTCYINLQTKFEVSNYIYDEDTKSGAKCRNWCSLEG